MKNGIEFIRKLNFLLLYRKHRASVLTLVLLFIFLFIWTTPKPNNIGTIKIYDRHGGLIFEKAQNAGMKEVVNLEDVSPFLIKAVVIHEDKNYWKHHGVDFFAIVRAILNNIKEGEVVSGASTITQQYARITIPYLKRHGINYLRKIREILVALRIEMITSKEDILEGYLNSVYLGNNVYGIQSASKFYFGKEASDLSLAESAMLIGVISSPRNNPLDNYTEANRMKDIILSELYESGDISVDEYKDAVNEKVFITGFRNNINDGIYFAEYVIDQLYRLPISTDGYKGGISVFTTFDKNINSHVYQITRKIVTDLKEEHNLSNAAVIVIDNSDRGILAMIGGVNYGNGIDGNINMVTANRQPGSAIKPITYALAFMNGYTPDTKIEDEPKRFYLKSGDTFVPHNYDNKYRGLVTLRVALASSLNMPAVDLLSHFGVDNFLKLSRKLGITTFRRLDKYDLAVTLGGAEVNLLELSNVYATFGNNGEYVKPYSIVRVVADNGVVLYKYTPQVASHPFGENGKRVSSYITDILSDNDARSTGFGYRSPLNLTFPVAVKTGTTTDWHDNWTIGYNDDYTVGVWVGNNDNQPLSHLTGVTGAAPIWHDSFEWLMKNRKTDISNTSIFNATKMGDHWNGNTTSIQGSIPNADLIHDDDLLQITFPKNNSELALQPEPFQNAPFLFEVYKGGSVGQVNWIVDGVVVHSGDQSTNIIWYPKVGKHTLEVSGDGYYDKSTFEVFEKEDKFRF